MSFSEWLCGNAEKSIYTKSVSLAMGDYISGIIIGIVFFEGPFSILINQISDLGDTHQNPIGSIIFNAGLILSGLFMMMHANYVYHILSPDVKPMSLLSAGFFLIGGLGNMMVGFFPQNLNWSMHLTSAILSIGGIIFSFLLSFIPMMNKVKSKPPWLEYWQLFLIYILFFVIIIISVSFVGIPMLIKFYSVTYDAKYVAIMWPLCEWLIAMGSVIWIIGIMIISPKSPVQNK